MSAELHPAYGLARKEFAFKPTPELLKIVADHHPLHHRALALWYAIGTDRRVSRHLRPRRGEPQGAFDALREAGIPPMVVEIAREGFRKVGEPLCPFVSLLYPARQAETAFVEDDQFPPEVIIRDVPCWAYDIYTREGLAAYQVFLQGDGDTARWVRAHIAPAQRVNFLGGIVFRVEGGLCRQRLRWATADELRRLVDFECHGSVCPDATECLALMRGDIGLLNAVRSDVC